MSSLVHFIDADDLDLTIFAHRKGDGLQILETTSMLEAEKVSSQSHSRIVEDSDGQIVFIHQGKHLPDGADALGRNLVHDSMRVAILSQDSFEDAQAILLHRDPEFLRHELGEHTDVVQTIDGDRTVRGFFKSRIVDHHAIQDLRTPGQSSLEYGVD